MQPTPQMKVHETPINVPCIGASIYSIVPQKAFLVIIWSLNVLLLNFNWRSRSPPKFIKILFSNSTCDVRSMYPADLISQVSLPQSFEIGSLVHHS